MSARGVFCQSTVSLASGALLPVTVKRETRLRSWRPVRVIDVDLAVGGEVRVERQAEQPALVVGARRSAVAGTAGRRRAWRPGWATQTVPSRSAISIRPSGVNFELGRLVEADDHAVVDELRAGVGDGHGDRRRWSCGCRRRRAAVAVQRVCAGGRGGAVPASRVGGGRVLARRRRRRRAGTGRRPRRGRRSRWPRRVTVPLTGPAAGEVSATVGAVVSGGGGVPPTGVVHVGCRPRPR